MSGNGHRANDVRGIAFLGNYPPRACGIATFTHDLATAVASQAGGHQPVIVAAMNDSPDGYAYPERVKFELRQDYKIDYSTAADFINFSHTDVVSVQHEYGIYGGEYGSNVLTFLRDLNRPAVVTCHTVLKDPLSGIREVLREIADQSEKLVVMSKRAFGFLENSYGIPRKKIAFIPHGIHDVPFIDPNYYKDKFGVEGRRVLLTFGLLARTKGIEYMIDALPEIVSKHPNTTYVILGATHPAVVLKEGESYRLSLQRKVRDLGLEDHVLFYPRFVETGELLEYLGAADIFVTPYIHLSQITSGALAYAMGAGKAVVSTPFWHAEELLADGRGCLVPPRDTRSLAREINSLLDDEARLNAMRKRAYNYCREMVWSKVAQSYLSLFDELRTHASVQVPRASAMRSPIAATNLPQPKLDHLLRLTDDTGPSRYARYAVPDWSDGYSLEDAAATLVASTKFYAIYKNQDALKLAEICLALVQVLIGDGDAPMAAGLEYNRSKYGTAEPDAVGKVLWSLGYVVERGPEHLRAAANDLFNQILPQLPMESPRAASYALLGASSYLLSFPGASAINRFLRSQYGRLEEFVSTPNWFEKWRLADWPTAAQACCVVGRILNDDHVRCTGRKMIAQICEVTESGTVFLRSGANPIEEESPVTAATFIEALGASYWDNREPERLLPIRSAVDWFLGVNRQNRALYDFSTGGCHDAVTATGINNNQGTESTVYCLLAFLSMNHLAGRKDVQTEPQEHSTVRCDGGMRQDEQSRDRTHTGEN